MHQRRYLFGITRLLILAAIVGGVYHAPRAEAQQAPANDPESKSRQETDEFYRPDQIQVIHVKVSDKDLEKLHATLPHRIYVPATFQWGEHTIKNVGIRYKGNSSSNPNQPFKRSFLIKFSEFKKGRDFLGLERVALDNGIQFGSLFSEQLITSVLRDLNLKASRCNFAKLYLNGKYHGVYTNVERIDKVFIKSNFAEADGALYKNDEGGVGAALTMIRQSPAANQRGRLAFEPKSKSAHKDARDVLDLISKVNLTPDEDFIKVMEETIDMDAFLKTMAVMLYSGAFDQLTGVGPHNYYLYHDPQSDRWNYLPWDLDVGFSDNAFGRVPVIDGWNAAWPMIGGAPSPLVRRIIENPQLRARYRRIADTILERYFHPNVLLPKVDELYARIKDDLAADPFPHRRVTNPADQDYEGVIASIKQFVKRRYKTARAQLDNPGVRPPAPQNPNRGKEPQPGKPSADAPRELRITSASGSSVTLQWKDNAEGEAGHLVQRAEGEKGQEFRNVIGKPGTDITSATDNSVVPGRIYRYRVYAVTHTPSGPHGSGVSNVVTVRVPGNK
ncbi:MAG: CotH kinase family protein [Pirellulaceae bacterium]